MDKGNRLEVVACPAMASVGWTKARKMVACRFYANFGGLFFDDQWLFKMADLNSGLLTVLMRVWW